jgi:hypothetical protein
VGEHGLTDLHREALRFSEVALVPVTPGLDVWALEETVRFILAAKVKGALLVSQNDGGELGRELRGVLQGHGLPVLRTEVSYGQTWKKAHLAGMGVTLFRPHSSASRELRALLVELRALGGRT